MLPKNFLENQNAKSELEYLIYHLQNVFQVISNEAVDMKKKSLESHNKSKEDISFENGCVYGYYRALLLIKMHAEDFGIPLSVFYLDKFDPDKELV